MNLPLTVQSGSITVRRLYYTQRKTKAIVKHQDIRSSQLMVNTIDIVSVCNVMRVVYRRMLICFKWWENNYKIDGCPIEHTDGVRESFNERSIGSFALINVAIGIHKATYRVSTCQEAEAWNCPQTIYYEVVCVLRFRNVCIHPINHWIMTYSSWIMNAIPIIFTSGWKPNSRYGRPVTAHQAVNINHLWMICATLPNVSLR